MSAHETAIELAATPCVELESRRARLEREVEQAEAVRAALEEALALLPAGLALRVADEDPLGPALEARARGWRAREVSYRGRGETDLLPSSVPWVAALADEAGHAAAELEAAAEEAREEADHRGDSIRRLIASRWAAAGPAREHLRDVLAEIDRRDRLIGTGVDCPACDPTAPDCALADDRRGWAAEEDEERYDRGDESPADRLERLRAQREETLLMAAEQEEAP